MSHSEDSRIEFERPFDTTNHVENILNSGETATALQQQQPSRIQAGLPPLNFRASRRGSVSAESYQPLRRPSTLPVSTVAVSDNARLAVKNNFLFKSLDQEQLALVFNGMTERAVQAGETIITQGEEGDNFYIVEAGKYSVEVDGKEVVQIGPGGSFGELALMYNSPRAASVKALEPGILYAVDRPTFRRVIIDLAHEKRCKYMDFLKSLPLLATTLSDLEIGKIADALEEVVYPQSGQAVIKQGDPGDAFYIVLEGVAAVQKDGNHVGTLNPGDYFGELALLNRQPRAATILVHSAPLKCLRLGEADFVRLLGPLEQILKRNEEQYKQYKQYIE